MENLLTRDYARKYFSDKNLNYADIRVEDIYVLCDLCDNELDIFNDGLKELEGINLKPIYMLKSIRVSNWQKNIRGIEIKQAKGKMTAAYTHASGNYFDCRELISFNTDGFIGFSGNADDKNVQPVLKAFIRFCDFLYERKCML